MLKVGGKPVLEKIIVNLLNYGFKRFYITVHYRAEMLEEYFGDGSEWGADIRYIHEPVRLGTAGALAMLPETTKAPLLVMNADLLTEVNFHQLLMFHEEQRAKATMCVRQYDFQVPYGVVDIERTSIKQINEKPSHRFCVNAGIYVLEPSLLNGIAKDTYLDMNTFFDGLLSKSEKVAAFALREKWIDIGAMNDFVRAQDEFDNDVSK
jgi:NDP-sugar pyrophosphorylase family protein